MTTSVSISASVSTLPELLQEPVRNWTERLGAALNRATLSEDQLEVLQRVVAGSEFGASVLLRYWDEIASDFTSLEQAAKPDAWSNFADEFARSDRTLSDAKAGLRRFRNLELLRLVWREFSGLACVEETIEALSDVADQSLRAAAGFAQQQMLERFGYVRDDDGDIVPIVILGMGKLGGRELNFSSDIDIIFAYPRDGVSDGRKALHAQPYFDRLSRNIVALMDETTADGFVFRTDTRLRPFGDSGPPVVSFAALESYLVQHGRDWERYAYIKARIVGPQPDDATRKELFEDLIDPFVYRRYLDYGVFESLREMHAMISADVVRRELRDNIKLGPGGIREIEFIVQSLQLVRGGGRPQLQSQSLLEVLPLLVDGRGISEPTCADLLSAYRYLRRLENVIQMIGDKQTHELPSDDRDRTRAALGMRCKSWDELVETLDKHRARVTQHFGQIAFRGQDEDSGDGLWHRLSELWDQREDETRWRLALEEAGFHEAVNVARCVHAFQEASTTRKIDAQSAERLATFIPRLLILVRDRAAPELAVKRCLAVVERVLRRSAYIALLNENSVAAERLVDLCGRSVYIADEIARFPVLLDELLDPRLMSGPLQREELDHELGERMVGIDDEDVEGQMERLAQFQRANLFRVAVADFSGEMPIMKVSDSLTLLAEVVLAYALRVAWHDLAGRHGVPQYELNGNVHDAGFGIIAYGKLGGLELSYGSDLDIVFLHDSKGRKQQTNGERSLDNSVFFSRLIRRLVHFLTTQTSAGILYEVDTRLRPSGRKGLLVTSTEAFARYQQNDAWTWEHQALLRARAVAGSKALADEFNCIRSEILTQHLSCEKLRKDVAEMRARMRLELDRGDDKHFDLKQGKGGIADIEFLVQYLVLLSASAHPAVIEYSDNIRQLNALAECDALPLKLAYELQQIYRHYRRRSHHLALNGDPPLVPAEDFTEERRTVSEAWQRHLGS